MKCRLFHRTILLVGVKRTLGASCTITLADLRFTQCRHRPKSKKKIQEVNPRFTLAGGDIAKFGIGELDRETCTQGALQPDTQLCSIEDPTFHCKV
ncbi:predicted protein [Lichtheimia corymbifera JMRC:FSU:9682]|uniref:Secreted protein n=1 Tax=Lichtheimia corymbifera JMRC:FSU:9682 TaxID=1263082 RepID=A0A068SA26_9FUNG|nr:predicted protein [Lichtheimia corymbifera JMRC:FSU:9682]